jgi:arsenate reductase-like glutaredoxin family protein
MYKLFGISNCDTVKKAKEFLTSSGIEFHFVDFKKYRPTEDDLTRWSKSFNGLPVNVKGTTYKKHKEYFENLNEMEKIFERIHNFNVSVKELEGRIIFLRKLQAGGSNHSFGIHVAKLAGMPVVVLDRAKQMLVELEKTHQTERRKEKAGQVAKEQLQLSFFQLDDPTLAQIREQILDLDVDRLTPVEALMKLDEIKRILSGGAR